MNTQGADSYVVLSISGQQYVLPTAHVRSIISVANLTPVPGAPGQVAGVTNLRGDVIPVLRLQEDENTTGEQLALVVEVPDEDQEFPVALLIDEVNQITDAQISEVDSSEDMIDEDGVVVDVGALDGATVLILDVQRLVPDLKGVRK